MAKQQETLDGALRFISEKLAAQSTRPNIYNYKPHPKQYTFHSSLARLKLYIGGNRSGKTVGGIVEDILWLTGRHPYRQTPVPPVRGRVISVDFKDGINKIIQPELMRWLPVSELKNGSWEAAYSKEDQQLTLANGSTLDFMSYEQDVAKFAGTSMHFIHYDEEPPKDIFDESQARLIDTGGSSWITMTPLLGMTWIFDEVYEPGLAGTKESCEVINVDMTENPYLPEGEVQVYINGLSDDDKQSRVHGKFVSLGGLIYPNFDTKPGGLHVIEEFPNIPREWVWAVSLDHGFNNPTAALWHAISPDGRIITFHEHYQSGWVISQHANRIHEINKELGRGPDYYIGDPSIKNTDPITGTSIYEEYVKHGIPIGLANNDVRAGLVRVAGYMQPKNDGRPNWNITRSCPKTIWELGRYRWKTYTNKSIINKNNALEVPHKKDDHAADSLRYFIMSRPDLTSDYQGRSVATVNHNDSIGAPTAIVDPTTATRRDFIGKEDSDFTSDYNSSDFKEVDEMLGADW